MRKLIEIIAELGLTEWRQSAYQLRRFKKLLRQVQRLKHSTAKDPEQRAATQEAVRNAHREYLAAAATLLVRAA